MRIPPLNIVKVNFDNFSIRNQRRMRTLLFTYLSLLVMGFFVTSIIAIAKGPDYDDPCIGVSTTIKLSYVQWLQIYGWTNISIMAIALVCLWYYSDRQEYLTSIWWRPHGLIQCECIVLFVSSVVGLIFQIAWYIIGALLFFETVNDSCGVTLAIHHLGIGIFVMETVISSSSLIVSLISLLWCMKPAPDQTLT